MRVIVESPFSGGFANVKYSRRCLRDCLDRGESPYASHLLYTQKGVLDDCIPDERRKGIDAAFVWLEVCDFVAVYMDMGVSEGMVEGIIKATRANKPVRLRWINSARPEKIIQLPDAF